MQIFFTLVTFMIDFYSNEMFIIFFLLVHRPLQRMVIGMLLASLAFIIAGVVQFEVQAGDKTLKEGETKLVMFNAMPPTGMPPSFRIESMERNFTDIVLPPGEVCV